MSCKNTIVYISAIVALVVISSYIGTRKDKTWSKSEFYYFDYDIERIGYAFEIIDEKFVSMNMNLFSDRDIDAFVVRTIDIHDCMNNGINCERFNVGKKIITTDPMVIHFETDKLPTIDEEFGLLIIKPVNETDVLRQGYYSEVKDRVGMFKKIQIGLILFVIIFPIFNFVSVYSYSSNMRDSIKDTYLADILIGISLLVVSITLISCSILIWAHTSGANYIDCSDGCVWNIDVDGNGIGIINSETKEFELNGLAFSSPGNYEICFMTDEKINIDSVLDYKNVYGIEGEFNGGIYNISDAIITSKREISIVVSFADNEFYSDINGAFSTKMFVYGELNVFDETSATLASVFGTILTIIALFLLAPMCGLLCPALVDIYLEDYLKYLEEKRDVEETFIGKIKKFNSDRNRRHEEKRRALKEKAQKTFSSDEFSPVEKEEKITNLSNKSSSNVSTLTKSESDKPKEYHSPNNSPNISVDNELGTPGDEIDMVNYYPIDIPKVSIDENKANIEL